MTTIFQEKILFSTCLAQFRLDIDPGFADGVAILFLFYTMLLDFYRGWLCFCAIEYRNMCRVGGNLVIDFISLARVKTFIRANENCHTGE